MTGDHFIVKMGASIFLHIFFIACLLLIHMQSINLFMFLLSLFASVIFNSKFHSLIIYCIKKHFLLLILSGLPDNFNKCPHAYFMSQADLHSLEQ